MSLGRSDRRLSPGRDHRRTYVWADGMGDWQPLGQVDAIVSGLNGGVPSAAVESATPIATPIAAAAAPASSPPPPIQEPRTAAVKRDPGRRSADLFGGGMSAVAHTEDVSTSAPLFNGSAGMGANPTGARDENSVLFSLSALTAKAATGPSSPGNKTTASKDDSGLIDSKELL